MAATHPALSMSAPSAPAAPVLLGIAAALVTVSIWALWIVGMRAASVGGLPLGWLGLMRFGLPALILLPAWGRFGPLPKSVPRTTLALMVLGSGAPFFLIVAAGTGYAPAAEVGVLLPGTMPLFVALFAALFFGERLPPDRLGGFALIFLAMALIGGGAVAAGAGYGRLLLPLGAALWAVYTLALRRSGLPPLAAAGIVAFWSTLLLLPLAAHEGVGPILAASPGLLLAQLVSQTLLSGLLGLIAYGYAVRQLGATRAAAFSALAPALAALFAVPLIGEWPSTLAVIGIAAAVLGVGLASGALGRRGTALPKRGAAA